MVRARAELPRAETRKTTQRLPSEVASVRFLHCALCIVQCAVCIVRRTRTWPPMLRAGRLLGASSGPSLAAILFKIWSRKWPSANVQSSIWLSDCSGCSSARSTKRPEQSSGVTCGGRPTAPACNDSIRVAPQRQYAASARRTSSEKAARRVASERASRTNRDTLGPQFGLRNISRRDQLGRAKRGPPIRDHASKTLPLVSRLSGQFSLAFPLALLLLASLPSSSPASSPVSLAVSLAAKPTSVRRAHV